MIGRFREKATKMASGSRANVNVVEIVPRREPTMSQLPNKDLNARGNLELPNEPPTKPHISVMTTRVEVTINSGNHLSQRRDGSPDPFIGGLGIEGSIVKSNMI